jgi:flavodoxin I
MKVLVIYDSFFGNTEKIARAIGASIAPHAEVRVVRVTDIRPDALTGLDVLIIGSPTRGFRPSPLVQEFLKAIPDGALEGVKATAFDTSIPKKEMPFFIRGFGYAAKPILDALKSKGAEQLVEHEDFYVGGEQGPLKEGELERAAAWIKLA